MKPTLCCLLVVCGALAWGGGDVALTEGGKNHHAIAGAAAPTEAESFAAQELVDFLKRSTGAALPIVKEADLRGRKAVYVGQTHFAAKQGIAFATLGPDEWVVRAVEGNLIIAGGRPRGTLYGVYEFLERVVGVCFLDAHTEHVPSKPTLTVAGDLAIRQTPAFFRREIYMVRPRQPKHSLFQVRRKINAFANADHSLEPKLGFAVRFGSPYSTHSHHRYTKSFPTDKPDYYALTEKGTRTGPGPQGQVCMSHPEVRKLFAARMREFIKQDREQITKAGRGEPFPRVYDLTPNDNQNKCVCDRCKAMAAKYGAYSGVVLEFTNAIAEDIARDYPEILVQTGAYTFYLDAPRGIRPRANVMIRIAQLGAEFNTLPKRDTLRSMLHPLNAKARKVFEERAQAGTTLGVHDYWTAWSQPFQWPHANIHGLVETLRLYHRCGVRDFLVEDELFGSRLHNFVDLQFYLGSRLLQDPTQDAKAIIDGFMRLYYGDAAPAMKRMLAYLEQRQEEQPGSLATVPPAARVYFDPTFFVETDAMLGEAERRVAGDALRLAHVRQERLAFDEAMLHLWNKLKSARRWPFSREKVLERLQRSYAAAHAKYGGWGAARKQADETRLEYLRHMPPIPHQFEGKKLIDICGPQLSLGSGGGRIARRVPDPQATVGRAWRLDASMTKGAGDHGKPPVFGLYDNRSKLLIKQTLAAQDVPQDERYHMHLAGRMKATPTMYFWAHHSWRLAQRLRFAYDSSLPDQKTYDVYVSIKLEGPAYVRGSTRPNSFSIDRLILVEVADQARPTRPARN